MNMFIACKNKHGTHAQNKLYFTYIILRQYLHTHTLLTSVDYTKGSTVLLVLA